MPITATPIDNRAALAAWLASLTDRDGNPLNGAQVAALLGVSRSSLFYQQSDSDNPVSAADKIRPALLATIEALDLLRAAAPAEFALLVERRTAGVKACPGMGRHRRPRAA